MELYYALPGNMMVTGNPDFYQEAARSISLKRHAVPREMAGVVLMLVSDVGSYLNGETITVDGRMTATPL